MHVITLYPPAFPVSLQLSPSAEIQNKNDSFCERGGKFKEWTTWLCCGKLREKHLAMK